MEFITQFLPIVLIFFLGIFCRFIKLLNKESADFMLKLVFYITLPALALISFYEITLKTEFILIPVSAILVIFSIYLILSIFRKFLGFERRTLGTFLIGCLIINTGFALPFFTASHKWEGFVRASLFDLGNSLLIFTFIYFIAIKHSQNNHSTSAMMKKFLKLPPIYALLIGLLLNITKIHLPKFMISFLKLTGEPTIPLIMLSLGIYFSPELKNFGKISSMLFIRMGLGLMVGILISSIFKFEGLTRMVVIVSSAAPIGYNTLIFSNMENLDSELAASAVSYSIFIGIFYLPILIYFFG